MVMQPTIGGRSVHTTHLDHDIDVLPSASGYTVSISGRYLTTTRTVYCQTCLRAAYQERDRAIEDIDRAVRRLRGKK